MKLRQTPGAVPNGQAINCWAEAVAAESPAASTASVAKSLMVHLRESRVRLRFREKVPGVCPGRLLAWRGVVDEDGLGRGGQGRHAVAGRVGLLVGEQGAKD